MKNKNILVLGGNGFLGKNFVNKFKKNNKISVVYLKEFKKKNNDNIKYIKLNLCNYNDFKRKLSLNFDFIVNFSGYVNHASLKDAGMKVIENHLLTLFNLIEYYKDSKYLKKFLHIGSSDEYGDKLSPQSENIREMPLSPYSFSKTSGVHFLQMANKNINFPAVSCRIFLSYGPYQDTNRLIPQVIYGCLKDIEFPVSSGQQYRDFCYVDDVMNGISKLLNSKNTNGEVYNIGGLDEKRNIDIVIII